MRGPVRRIRRCEITYREIQQEFHGEASLAIRPTFSLHSMIRRKNAIAPYSALRLTQ